MHGQNAHQGAAILIVDDDPVNLSILFNYLRDMGFQVFAAQDGETALEQAQSQTPDAILLDILMPELDGFETCRRLKSQPSTSTIPIIFMTALTNTRDMVTGFEMGAVDYITKPFTPEEILVRLTTHLTLHQQSLELTSLNTMKNKFFEIISKDMTSALSSLVSLSDFLVMAVSEMPGDTVHDAAKMIENSVQNAMKLLENLSHWAKIQNGTFGFHPEILNLHELVLENIVQLRSPARAKHIMLSHSISADTRVYTDYTAISTILHNLLVNALWFTQDGGAVDVTAKTLDGFVQITVTDSGIGIQSEDVRKLFRIDQKFQMAGTAGEHGTGLGLVLCKDLVEIAGGELGVKSSVGRGSSFTFTMPSRQTSPKPERKS